MSTSTSGLRERRSVLSRLTAGVAVLGAAAFRGESAAAQPAATAPWQPTRHAQDDWLDQIPGGHRFIFDTVSAAGVGSALLFANNFFIANQQGYGLGNTDAAVVIVARHYSTAFAFSDAMWAKYGAAIGEAAGDFNDPRTKSRPSINVFNSSTYGTALPNGGVTLDTLIGRGVHFAVCQMATRRFAGAIATAHKLDAEAVYKELTSNLIRNSHLAVAGILAVNRAQERGYALAYGG